jgi:hypothetical protein
MTQPKSGSGQSGSPDVTDKIKLDAEAAKAKAADVKSDALRKVKAEATAKAQEGAGVIADEVDAISHAARSAARTLAEDQNTAMSEEIAGWADGLATFASNLRESSVDDLIRDARKIAHKSPAGFLLGTIAVGFVAARFAKATATREDRPKDESRLYDPAQDPGAPDRDVDFQPISRAGSTDHSSPAATTVPPGTDSNKDSLGANRRGETL